MSDSTRTPPFEEVLSLEVDTKNKIISLQFKDLDDINHVDDAILRWIALDYTIDKLYVGESHIDDCVVYDFEEYSRTHRCLDLRAALTKVTSKSKTPSSELRYPSLIGYGDSKLMSSDSNRLLFDDTLPESHTFTPDSDYVRFEVDGQFITLYPDRIDFSGTSTDAINTIRSAIESKIYPTNSLVTGVTFRAGSYVFLELGKRFKVSNSYNREARSILYAANEKFLELYRKL